MKKTITMAAATLALVAGAQAATILVVDSIAQNAVPEDVTTNANGTGSGSFDVSGSDVSVVAPIEYNLVQSGTTKTYSITGYDFDGDGSSDTLNYQLQAIGDLSGITNGEATTFNIIGISVDNSDAGFETTVDAGFTQFYRNRTRSFNLTDSGNNAVTWFYTGGQGGNNNGNSNVVNFAATNNVTLTSTDGSGFSYVAQGYALELTTVAVPEPSSTALLGLGGLALILRRRK